METEKAIEILKYELDQSKVVKKYQGKPMELFEDLDDYIEALETVLKELEKKDKMIELMAVSLLVHNIGKGDCGYHNNKYCEHNYKGHRHNDCRKCIEQYFENKAEESE